MNYKISKNIVQTLLLVILVLIVNLFFGDLLQAKIATWHWVQKYHLINPRVPLVINTREEIRPNDVKDLVSAVSSHKNKIVALVSISNGSRTLIGSAVALTSDGVFLTAKNVVGDIPAESIVSIQTDGKELKVKDIFIDPVTTLVLFKTSGSGLSVAALSSNKELVAGEKVIMLGAQSNGDAYVLSSILSGTEHMSPGTIFSDVPSRNLPMQAVFGAMPGQAVIDLFGTLVGIWDGTKLVPASIAEETLASFLSNGSISRPKFGFYYRFVSKQEANQYGSVPGFKLVVPQGEKNSLIAGSPASLAGLLTGDTITHIGGEAVAEVTMPELLLSTAKLKAELTFVVNRNGKSLEIKITPN